jgi:multisubunit Na+/H+ antiporter MnhF subunit
MLLIKLIIVILLIFIVISLFTALYYLIKSPDSSASVVKSLSIRIGLSLFLIVLIFVGSKFGFIQPHGFGQ